MGLTCPKCFQVRAEAECGGCGVRTLDLSDAGDRDILNYMLRIKDRSRWTIASLVGGVPGVGLGFLGLFAAAEYFHQRVVVPRVVVAIPGVLLAALVYGLLRALASKHERRARALAEG